LLARYVDEVTIGYDGDEAGEKATRRSLPILLAAGLTVRRALFPAGHDPDSLRVEAGAAAVRERVEAAEDAVWLELRRLIPPIGKRTPAVKTRAAGEIAEMLRPIRDPIVRGEYSKRAAEHLGVPEDLFLRRLGPELYRAGAADEPQRARETRSEEEKGLVLLLRPDEPIPHPDQLPPPDAFLDADCRNIYAVFGALYRSGGKAPGVDEVLAKLSSEGGAIDRVARLLLEETVPEEGGLVETLNHILRRWRKQRLVEVMQQIRQAQEQDDQARLIQLLEEKKALNRSQHPDMTGNWW
ncbi:MAG: hypothetical protein GY856_13965, partial [bacterium]|nr:hypothetical protein [bacterium]